MYEASSRRIVSDSALGDNGPVTSTPAPAWLIVPGRFMDCSHWHWVVGICYTFAAFPGVVRVESASFYLTLNQLKS
jgi:hypothetical protein